MTKYLRSNIYRLLLITAVVCFSIQCTKVNHQLGDSIIPSDGLLEVEIETLTGFEIHTVDVDSIRVDLFANGYIGEYISPKIGRINMAYTSEFTTSLVDVKDNVKLDDYILDSVSLILSFANTIGNYNSKINVKMYELDKNFRKPYNAVYGEYAPEGYYDPYYSNFDYTKYTKPTALTTFEIDVQDVLQKEGLFTVKLPQEYGDRAMKLTLEDYKQDSIFRKIFKGMTLVAEPVYAAGAIMGIVLEESFIEFVMYEKKAFEEDEVKKSFSFVFYLTHIQEKELYSQMVTTIKVDRSFANENVAIPPDVINDTLTVQDFSYISGFGNIISRLKLPIDKLKELKNKLGDTPSAAIIVTNAILVIPIKDKSVAGLNSSLSSMSLYYNYSIPTYMPDFNASEGLNTYFGGVLNRSHNYYEMNITRYIQEVLNDKTEYDTLVLCPAGSPLFTDKVVSIINTIEDPISLRLTYSVSK